MPKTLPLSEVKAKLSEVVDEIVTTQERVTVTRNGRPVAVVISTDDLEAIEETLAILSDPSAMHEIQQARMAIASGDVVTKDDIETLRSQLRSKTA
ncbi:MAG: type II toxin-antitoxin system Phd/YefM family antitoxin [Acidimicrobiia bacterium]|nr:type II toxin-antitoxin system Phd/YefM family antitoxin [Acidimicrobiia bacterium]MBT8194521.1 type II toxin-antitoxin system Phd/YefM family antitoxin [Acidimicrobiia bacterium]MBT8246802.1 type II toxin-antitoxin system Phd/YefM family antitoxin [Acidimicrobiia bacterium]NNF87434.1 type II toxin-antitoxin system Phd/YefM family antitoxin [Acidimicrobiia bacterium]NNJ47110.1 type II toxin-antitoxin system Phd/YefM family antitoxin [Acidimicrobiia bacterium]